MSYKEIKNNIRSPQNNQEGFFPPAKIAMLLFFSRWRGETLNKETDHWIGF